VKSVIRRFKLLYLFILLLVVNAALLYYLSQDRFSFIVLHHSASSVDNYSSIKKFHWDTHHWSDAAYHLILSNGSTEVPLGHLEATSRYRLLSYSLATRSRGCNLRGVHLSIVGNYEEEPLPENLKAPLAHAITLLRKRFRIGKEQIRFHKDCSSTACPGKFIKTPELFAWINAYADRCPSDIRTQQEMVVSDSQFSIHSIIRVNPIPLFLSMVTIAAWFLTFFVMSGLEHRLGRSA